MKKGGVYHHNASGERKSTGSYFTPTFAVEHLLDRALDPTLDEHLERVASLLNEGKTAEAAEQFFDFRVADLAMGSGHFLVAAIDHIEVKMNAFLVERFLALRTNSTGWRRPPATLWGGRQVADDRAADAASSPDRRRCIYGLDMNEIAVELARVAIWIHTFVPGLPMSTLDHNLVWKLPHGYRDDGEARMRSNPIESRASRRCSAASSKPCLRGLARFGGCCQLARGNQGGG